MPFLATVHAEWIKIRSLRSLAAAPLVACAVTVGATDALCATLGTGVHDPGFDPLSTSYGGLSFGQWAISVFGALVMTSEYRAGAISVSLAAVPRRRTFYAAKSAVVAVLALVVGLVTGLASFLSGQALIGREDPTASLQTGDPGVARAVFGCGLHLALIAVFSVGLAALLRSTTGVLCLVTALFLLAPFVFADTSHGHGWTAFLPDHAGRQILLTDPSGPLGAWRGMAVLAGWAAAAAAAGGVALSLRDA